MATKSVNLREKFMGYVEVDAQGCWLWKGAIKNRGYGAFFPNGRRGTERAAHCWAYEEFRGPIPEWHVLDHLCRVRWCVNPDHLEPVSMHENIQRGRKAASRSHCSQGHPFDEENTLHTKKGRRCRACKEAWTLRARGDVAPRSRNPKVPYKLLLPLAEATLLQRIADERHCFRRDVILDLIRSLAEPSP